MKYTFSLFFFIELLILFALFGLIIKNKLFYAQTKKQVKFIEENELRELIRQKKQVFDTREKDDLSFDYILGVRNVTQMDRMQNNFSFRADLPVYIVDWTEKRELKSANFFRKKGANEIYILKGAMSQIKGNTTGRFKKIDEVRLTSDELESL